MPTILSILVSSLLATTAQAQDTAPPSDPPAAGGGAGGAVEAAPPVDQAPPPTDPNAPPPEAAEAPKPKPAPYSPPFKMRPVVPLNVILVESTFAKYEDAAGNGGLTYVQQLLGAYKVTKEINVLARVGFVQDSAPSAPGAPITASGAAFINPVIGGAYNTKIGTDFKIGAFLGVTLPVGGGGGNPGDYSPFAKNARLKGVPARASMDNAMFAVNDFTVFPGVGFAYVAHGLTIQAEATILQLMRVRGENDQPEKSKLNSTFGLHVGYFVIPQLSFGAEFHYQRWLNGPIGMENAENIDEGARNRAQTLAAASRDQGTVQIGPRAHFKVGDVWIRPGIGYERGTDFPMSAASNNYHNVQLHVPIIFP